MAQSDSRVLEFHVAREEAGAVFTRLAAAMESGMLELHGESASVQGFRRMDLSLKPEADGVRVKIKIKPPKDTTSAAKAPAVKRTTAGKAGKESYKSLKKRMKREFKLIKLQLDGGALPEAELMQSFIIDSRSMCTYKGKGDTYYPAYLQETDKLEADFAAGGVAACRTHVAALDALMDACHDRYK